MYLSYYCSKQRGVNCLKYHKKGADVFLCLERVRFGLLCRNLQQQAPGWPEIRSHTRNPCTVVVLYIYTKEKQLKQPEIIKSEYMLVYDYDDYQCYNPNSRIVQINYKSFKFQTYSGTSKTWHDPKPDRIAAPKVWDNPTLQ